MGQTCSTTSNKSAIRSIWAKHDAMYSEAYYGAGCMFVGDRTFLAGLQIKGNQQFFVGGFGGRSLDHEHWRTTAFRETVEEFFHITNVPAALLADLEAHLVPEKILCHSHPLPYITLVYTYADLRTFLRICKKHLKHASEFAGPFPRSAEDLVHNRVCAHKGAEISNIIFWPRYFDGTDYRVSKDILQDLALLNHNLPTIEYV